MRYRAIPHYKAVALKHDHGQIVRMTNGLEERRRAALKRFFAARPRQRTAICRAAGVTESSVRNFLDGRSKSLEMATYDKLANSLGISVAVLLGDAEMGVNGSSDEQPQAADNAEQSPPPNARIVSDEIPMQVDRKLPYIPVYGTTQGGPDGRFELNRGEEIDQIPRPVVLGRAKNIFALYVEGDSMSPVFEAGDPAVINPDRPPRIGDYVCLLLKRGSGHHEPSCYIKRLVKRDDKKIVVKQLNPEKELTFNASDVQAVYRVYRPAELIMV